MKQPKQLRTRLRRLATLALLNLLCLLTIWSGPALAAAPSSYGDVQRSQLEKLQAPLLNTQARMAELGQYVVAEDWTNTSNFIHGPLGELRRYLATVSRNLPTQQQRQARTQAKALMSHLERLDSSARAGNSRLALQEYKSLVSSLDVFLQFLPEA